MGKHGEHHYKQCANNQPLEATIKSPVEKAHQQQRRIQLCVEKIEGVRVFAFMREEEKDS